MEGFLADSLSNLKAEFYLPQAVGTMILRKQAKVRVIPSGERWMGVTYANDRPVVQAALLQKVAEGQYPKSLWG